jgi:hypothetical protein
MVASRVWPNSQSVSAGVCAGNASKAALTAGDGAHTSPVCARSTRGARDKNRMIDKHNWTKRIGRTVAKQIRITPYLGGRPQDAQILLQ